LEAFAGSTRDGHHPNHPSWGLSDPPTSDM
jgi:hypothetical protein